MRTPAHQPSQPSRRLAPCSTGEASRSGGRRGATTTSGAWERPELTLLVGPRARPTVIPTARPTGPAAPLEERRARQETRRN
eukprot:8365748-Alexandrium_andersonii.AAC.1